MPEEVVILILGIFGLICSVPIVAIVAAHKRRMAEIQLEMLKAQGGGHEAQALRSEVNELKGLIYQQTIESDSLRQMLQSQTMQRATPPPPPSRVHQPVGHNEGQSS